MLVGHSSRKSSSFLPPVPGPRRHPRPEGGRQLLREDLPERGGGVLLPGQGLVLRAGAQRHPAGTRRPAVRQRARQEGLRGALPQGEGVPVQVGRVRLGGAHLRAQQGVQEDQAGGDQGREERRLPGERVHQDQ